MKKQRGYDYFAALSGLVNYCGQAADLLLDTLSNFNGEELAVRREEMHAVEHAADGQCHELLHHLAREFLAPLEREDIISLTHEIDDVTDLIEDVLMYIYMFNIAQIRPESLEMARTIQACCRELAKMFAEFPNYHKSVKLHESIVEINRLEEVNDNLYLAAMRHLYLNAQDAIEVMTWTTTFGCLEACCDACEHVANVVESVVMKNS